jgi:myo-inositol-1(or 4)-monophosphatase
MTDPEQERALLAVAQEAARAAATELQARFGHHQAGIRTKSTPTDLVSAADVAAEAAIRGVLEHRRPDDGILAEEGGASGGGELRWIVDPLDGTINFLFGIPVFAVSVACEDRDGVLAGVVLDPVREECFAATRSGDPTLNGVPIRASSCRQLSTAMIATGFAYDARVRAEQAEVLAGVLPRVRDIRRAGAAAIDLSWTACSRYDAYYERGLHVWDRAAGVLIASRAGLEVRELEPTGDSPAGVLVAPSALIEELWGLVDGS